MTTPLTAHVAQALYRIKVSPEFAELREFWRQQHAESLDRLMRLKDDTALRQEQGRAQALHELLERLEKSEALLASMK